MDVLWNETPEDRWQALMDRARAPFQQSWTYGEAARALGALVHRIEVRDGGRTVALAQGIERWCLRPVMLITMGPVWVGEVGAELQKAVLKELRGRHAGFFIDTPAEEGSRAACESAGLKDVMTPATLAELRLGPGFRKRMAVKWRNRLRVAEASGLKATRTTRRGVLDWLLEKDRQQQKTRRYRALPRAFTNAWQAVDPESVVVLTTGKGDDPTAAMLFLRHGKTATYHVGWSGEEGRAQNAHNLILSVAAQQLAEGGVERINLGLLDTETTPGLARFKLGAGATPLKTGGTWIGW